MSEPKEVRQARDTVRQRETSYVHRQVAAGRVVREQQAAGASVEQRQAQQRSATTRVSSKAEEAASQGQGS